MKTTRWLAPVIFLALSVGGCGSSPPVQYYDLESLETGYIDDGETFLRVGVGPLRTPDYLSRSQIVTRGKDSTVIVNDFNRWIEPLDDAIHRVVSENLDSLVDDAVVVAFPYTHIADLDYQLVGRISNTWIVSCRLFYKPCPVRAIQGRDVFPRIGGEGCSFNQCRDVLSRFDRTKFRLRRDRPELCQRIAPIAVAPPPLYEPPGKQ